MPKLTDEQRARAAERDALHKKAFEDYGGPRHVSQHCRVCNWASNGPTLDEADAINREHEHRHPHVKEWDEKAIAIPITEMSAYFHDHDCVFGICTCACGCQEEAGCLLVSSGMCAVCMVKAGRGDGEHGAAPGTPYAAVDSLVKEHSDLLFDTLNKMSREIQGRDWLLEGRGPYEWDDDRYKDEAGQAFSAVLEIVELAKEQGRLLWDTALGKGAAPTPHKAHQSSVDSE